MSQTETTPKADLMSHSELIARLVWFFLSLILFCTGYAAGEILSLPLPVPHNWVSLLFALAVAGFFSTYTINLFTVAVFVGRPLDRPPPPKGKSLDFPGWLLKQPYAGICLGVSLFISPLLIAIGASGIAYLLAAGFVLYATPRLLAHGLAGAALLLTAWGLAGFFLAKLAFSIPVVKACEGGGAVELRTGPAVPCDDFVFVERINGLVIRKDKMSVFVRIDDLAPSATKTLDMKSWYYKLEVID